MYYQEVAYFMILYSFFKQKKKGAVQGAFTHISSCTDKLIIYRNSTIKLECRDKQNKGTQMYNTATSNMRTISKGNVNHYV